jgi:hypothetical protein
VFRQGLDCPAVGFVEEVQVADREQLHRCFSNGC